MPPYALITRAQPTAVATPTQEVARSGSLSSAARRTDGRSAQAQFPAPGGVFRFSRDPSVPAGGPRLFTVSLRFRLTLCFGPSPRSPPAPGAAALARTPPQATDPWPSAGNSI